VRRGVERSRWANVAARRRGARGPCSIVGMTDLNELSLAELYSVLHAPGHVSRVLELARDEDLGPEPEMGDVTSRAFVGATARGTARVVIRSGGVVSGLACIDELLHVFRVDADARLLARDGQRVEPGTCVAELTGQWRGVLGVERTLLNLVGRLSGIATRTARFVEAARTGLSGAGETPRVLDTRKTTPGLRALEKYAVRCGGGFCHRLGLYDAVLIKDNHLAAVARAGRAGESFAQRVRAAARLARDDAPRAGLRFVELEVDTLEQLRAVVDDSGCGVDIVLLDNMAPPELAQAVTMRNDAGLARALLLEASGGVTLETIGAIAATGVDRISIGSLTHGAASLDVGLDVGLDSGA
jgi:nicotinate-nucleotide pyrophosphorylase (carboxylating)